jgi:hypothetical protein
MTAAMRLLSQDLAMNKSDQSGVVLRHRPSPSAICRMAAMAAKRINVRLLSYCW